MYLCEQCGKEVYEKFGSGRFCSRSCSNKYVALHQSNEAKAKKVEKGRKNIELGRHGFTPEARMRGLLTKARNSKESRRNKLEGILSNTIDPYNGGYSRFKDMLIEFGYKKHMCECCMNTEWMGKAIPLELHHISGNKKDNSLNNVQLLCPNCHSQTSNFSWKVYNSKRRKE